MGWVRNLPDGRVELLAGGAPEEVNEFLEAIAESELAGFIKGVHVAPADSTALAGVYGFQILA